MEKPFLKWVGGKTQLLDQILERLPKRIVNYYEPFLGGGAVLLAILSTEKVEGEIYASDLNETLIGCWKNLQSRLPETIRQLHKLKTRYENCREEKINRKPETLEDAMSSQESFYYWIRKCFNELEDRQSPKASAYFIFLNKTGFRGLYREGKNGYNVPFGHYRNPIIFDEEHLTKISTVIRRVKFEIRDFKSVLEENLGPKDFIFCDPPYYPLDKKSFVDYQASGFEEEKHRQLFELLQNLECRFLLSNSDSEEVKTVFEGFEIEIVDVSRRINSKNPGSRTTEVLIRNYRTKR